MIRRYGYIVVDHCGHRVMCPSGTSSDDDLRVAIHHAVTCPRCILATDLAQSRSTLTYYAPDDEDDD
jgi:hypothetical protein